MTANGETDASSAAATSPFSADLRVWATIGALSFGGPTAQAALMHQMLVAERGWISERRFLSGLSFCMLLPGPEAMQLATYIGWLRRGVWGGVAAGLLFVAPGAAFMFALAAVYVAFGQTPWVAAAFLGVKAAVIAIVVQALLRIGRRALTTLADAAVAIAAFIALAAFAAPFPAIVAVGAVVGAALGPRPADRTPSPSSPELRPPPTLQGTLRVAAIWTGVWIGPLLVLAAIDGHGLPTDAARVFSTLAVVTFGGAYAVLAFLAQTAVDAEGWLTAAQMIDGLGLAETTPGPLILVVQFTAFVAGAQAEGGGWGVAAAAALTALWATFAPCFLWIFVGAPHLEAIERRPRLRGALRGVSAAVVGVVATLATWFAAATAFRADGEPAVETIAIAAVSAGLLFVARRSTPEVLVAAAALGASYAAIARLGL